MRVLIIGAGGHSREVADLVRQQGHDIVAFLDDNLSGTHDPTGLPVHATIEPHEAEAFVVAIGAADARARLYDEWIGLLPALSVIASSAQVSEWSHLGSGIQIAQNVVVNANARICDDVILNVACVVSHDAVVGSHTHVAPGALIGGAATIGEGCLVGAGAVIAPGVSVGDGAVVGAGAVVIDGVDPGWVVAGVPARVIRGNTEAGATEFGVCRDTK